MKRQNISSQYHDHSSDLEQVNHDVQAWYLVLVVLVGENHNPPPLLLGLPVVAQCSIQ